MKFAQILDISVTTLKKSDLPVARMYVGCDNSTSIPRVFTTVIGSKCYHVTTKIEAQFMEPTSVRVTQEEIEREKRLLEETPEADGNTKEKEYLISGGISNLVGG